jgi:hypothetical protein
METEDEALTSISSGDMAVVVMLGTLGMVPGAETAR